MRGILYQKQPSPGYRENIQQEEILVKNLQLQFILLISHAEYPSVSSQAIITSRLTFIILFLFVY